MLHLEPTPSLGFFQLLGDAATRTFSTPTGLAGAAVFAVCLILAWSQTKDPHFDVPVVPLIFSGLGLATFAVTFIVSVLP